MASSGQIRIKHNLAGYRALRSSPVVRATLERMGGTIAKAANSESKGDGYKISSQQGAARPQGRWRVTVITANTHAVRDNAKHNRLVRLMLAKGGGRG